ncbi:hypothetical protein EJB05_26795, partial [Eragrostis curvula]
MVEECSNDIFRTGLRHGREDWHQALGTDCLHFKRCIKIAQLCTDDDPNKRPTIDCIIEMLNGKSFQLESPKIRALLLEKQDNVIQ